MKSPIMHFEIAGRDGPALESFYRELLGWRIERRDMGHTQYSYIDTRGQDYSGGIRHEPDGHAEVVVYFEVPDLDSAVAEAERLGATIRIPPMEGNGAYFALISDPEGNPAGLIQRVPDA
jgi:predicted enzyme related to lactoylglutathione lyase